MTEDQLNAISFLFFAGVVIGIVLWVRWYRKMVADSKKQAAREKVQFDFKVAISKLRSALSRERYRSVQASSRDNPDSLALGIASVKRELQRFDEDEKSALEIWLPRAHPDDRASMRIEITSAWGELREILQQRIDQAETTLRAIERKNAEPKPEKPWYQLIVETYSMSFKSMAELKSADIECRTTCAQLLSSDPDFKKWVDSMYDSARGRLMIGGRR